MIPSKKSLIVAAILLFFVFGAHAQKHTLVRFSFSSGWDALPAVVAIERGFFAEQGLVVSGLSISTASAVINSLAAGSTDFAAVPQRVLLAMAAANVPVKVVAMSGWGTEMELVTKRGVEASSLAGLKGKRVAVLNGSDSFPVLIRMLNREGLRPSDVQIAQLGASDLMRAFENNLADAVFESRHFTSVFMEKGEGRRIMTAADITKAIGIIGAKPLIVSGMLIEREPQTVEKFLRGWVKALVYIQEDPEDAGRMLQIFLHRHGMRLPDGVARSWVGMTRYDSYEWSSAAIADAEYNGWGLNVGGILKVAPKLGDFVDNSYVQNAVKAVGTQ